MIESPIITRTEWNKHIGGNWRTSHNIWKHLSTYVPGWGYSQAEIDAFFEGEDAGKKQVHWDRITSKPGTYPPSGHQHAWADVNKAGSNLTDLATRQHAGLTDITANQHHDEGKVKWDSGTTAGYLDSSGVAGLLQRAYPIKWTWNAGLNKVTLGLLYSTSYFDLDGTNQLRIKGTTMLPNVNADMVDGKHESEIDGTGKVRIKSGETPGYLGELRSDGVLHAAYPIGWTYSQPLNKITLSLMYGTSYFELDGSNQLRIKLTTKLVNVNADMVDGKHDTDFAASSHTHVKADITDTPWAWTDVSKTGSNLTDLATRQHAGLTDITSDQHHAQSHVLSGSDHTASGLTTGNVIRASGATTFAWAQLGHGDLGGVSANQHHDEGKVAVDVAATPDYLGATRSSGVLQAALPISYVDGGNKVTIGLMYSTSYFELDGSDNLRIKLNSLLVNVDADKVDGLHASEIAGTGEIKWDSGTAKTYLGSSATGGGLQRAYPISWTWNAGLNKVTLGLLYNTSYFDLDGSNQLRIKLTTMLPSVNADMVDGYHWNDIPGVPKVAVDAVATPDYLGATRSSGALQAAYPIKWTDGGDKVTLGLMYSDSYFELDGSNNLRIKLNSLLINVDADKLDGEHGSYYRNADNLNAGIVPSARLSPTQGFYSTDPYLPVTNDAHSCHTLPTIAELSIPNSPYIENKLQFIVPIIHEYTENGVDWYATSYTATQLKKWVAGRNMGANLVIPSPTIGEWEAVRFTFQAPVYVFMNWLYLYMSNGGHQYNFKIEKSYGAETDNWSTVAQTGNTGGWPSHESIPHTYIRWAPIPTPGLHSKYIRLTIYPVYNPSYPDNSIIIYNINWYGYYSANPQTDTWYWDENNDFYIRENFRMGAGKKLYLGTYFLDSSGLVADNKVADSNKLNGQLGSYYAVSGGAEHDGFSDFVAAEHKSLPNTIAQVLSDHNLAAHTALGLFNESSDVDHAGISNVLPNQHHAESHTLASHSTKPHSALTDVTANQHHDEGKVKWDSGTVAGYLDSSAVAGLLQRAYPISWTWNAGLNKVTLGLLYSTSYFDLDGSNQLRIKLNSLLVNVDADMVDGLHASEIAGTGQIKWDSDTDPTYLGSSATVGGLQRAYPIKWTWNSELNKVTIGLLYSTTYFDLDGSNNLRIKLNTLLTGVDADKVDGEHASAIVTDTRVKAHFPDTIANILSDHDKATHDALALDHGDLSGKGDDDHTQYILVDGTRAFSGVVSGITPTVAAHLATKGYVDTQVGGVNEFVELTDTPSNYTGSAGKFVKVNATPDALVFASIAWGDVSKTGSNLTDLATRQHAGLTDVTSDQHHNQSHVLSGSDHTASGLTAGNVIRASGATTFAWAQLGHGDLAGVSVDQHHDQSHTLASHSTKAHSELSDAPADAHHAQVHASEHHVAGGDLINHDSLTGFVAAEHLSLPNTIANVLSDHNLAAHTALGLFNESSDVDHAGISNVLPNQHHAQSHTLASHSTKPHSALTDVTANQHHDEGKVKWDSGTTAGYLDSSGVAGLLQRAYPIKWTWSAGLNKVTLGLLYSTSYFDLDGSNQLRIKLTTMLPSVNADMVDGYHWDELPGVPKVAVDSVATPDYLGATRSSGALQAAYPIKWTDGGDKVTIGLMYGTSYFELDGSNNLRIKLTTKLVSVNADMVDGKHDTDFAASSHTHVKADITDTPWAWTDVSKTGSNLTDLVTRQHAGLTNVTSDQHHPQSHTLVSHTARDHHNLIGLGDDDHSQYYNAARHTTAVHDALSINAHRVDGYHASQAAGNNTVVVRSAAGYIFCNYLNCTSGATATTPTHYFVETGNDSYLRQMTPANFVAKLSLHGLMPKSGGAFTGAAYAADHGGGTTDMLVNVCYGTGSPPLASSTTIGTLFVKYV